jgi:hypothetical protein
MKHLWLVVVLLCLGVSVGAWAQTPLLIGLYNPRSLGMGAAGIGVADDALAWAQNPAGLAALSFGPQAGQTWASDVSGAYAAVSGEDVNFLAFNYSGWKPESHWGAGAGLIHLNEGGYSSTLYGAGFGIQIGQHPCSVGANFLRSSGGGSTLVSLGAMHRFRQEGLPPVRLGLVVDDVTSQQGGAYFHLGVAWPATKDLLIAVDGLNITNKYGDGVDIDAGAEYKFGRGDCWRARLGTAHLDGNKLTYGLGYAVDNWRIDAAAVSVDGETLWSAGAAYNF